MIGELINPLFGWSHALLKLLSEYTHMLLRSDVVGE